MTILYDFNQDFLKVKSLIEVYFEEKINTVSDPDLFHEDLILLLNILDIVSFEYFKKDSITLDFYNQIVYLLIKEIFDSNNIEDFIDINSFANTHVQNIYLFLIEHKLVDLINVMLDKKMDLNKQDSFGKTVIYKAVENNNIEATTILLNIAKERNINILENKYLICNQNLSPLHIIVLREDYEMMKLLLDHNADINIVNKLNIPPLHYFINKYQRIINHGYDYIKFLLTNNANPNILTYENNNAFNIFYNNLHHSCSLNGYIDFVKLFIEYKTDITNVNIYNINPFALAIKDKCEYIITEILNKINIESITADHEISILESLTEDTIYVYKELISKGWKISNKQNLYKLLIRIIEYNFVSEDNERFEKFFDDIKFIIDQKIDMNYRESSEHSFMLYSILSYDSPRLFNLFIENGANKYLLKGSKNILHISVEYYYYNIINILKDDTILLNMQYKGGFTPINKAIIDKNIKAFDLLLPKSDLNIPDMSGNTCLHNAIWSTELTLKLLSNPNVNINAINNNKQTALYLALEKKIDPVIEYYNKLIMHKKITESQDNEGNTVLHIAAKKGYINTVILLIQNGFNKNAINNQKKTFRDIAEYYDNKPLLQYIKIFEKIGKI